MVAADRLPVRFVKPMQNRNGGGAADVEEKDVVNAQFLSIDKNWQQQQKADSATN